jgi:predicted Fe-S protein YdhL (DUF1289 family)
MNDQSQNLTLESPCVRNCCLNDDDVCLGCGRSLREITAWSVASDEAKKRILDAASERRRLMSWRQST